MAWTGQQSLSKYYNLTYIIMIDQQQIERILEEVKISSISDIVSFIASFVSKTALQPLEDLQARLCELQRPKGMDRIMIEEVKALVEAMLDQREETFYKQIDRRCKQNVCSSFQIPENSRRSLNEIDFMNIVNMQKGTQSQQLRKNSTIAYTAHPRVDSLNNEIRQIRDALLNKPERKQLQQLKATISKIDKQLVSKISFEQTEKLVLRFQRDIFVNFNERRGSVEEIQAKLMQKVQEEMQRLSLNIQESLKGKGPPKIERKLKHVVQDLSLTQGKIDKLEKQASQRHKSCLENFESLQSLISQMAEEKGDLMLMQSKRDQLFSSQAFWMSAPPSYKNSQVVWERQIFNSDSSGLEFESGKTGIRLISAGFYEIACSIYGGNGSLKKGPVLLCNSELIGRLETCGNGSESLPRWRFREFVHVRQNRSTLTIRLQGEENSSCISLMIRKISY